MTDGLKSVLAIDYGAKRVGFALANHEARIASALTTLDNSSNLFKEINKVVKENNVVNIVVGYPRGLDGQSTDQTREVENFINSLKESTNIPINIQDEALTSQKAEIELNSRGKPYTKADIDSLAAVYILEDWLNDK